MVNKAYKNINTEKTELFIIRESRITEIRELNAVERC